MHQSEELHSPELCKYVIQQLNQQCGTSIPEPEFVKEVLKCCSHVYVSLVIGCCNLKIALPTAILPTVYLSKRCAGMAY